MNNSLASEGGVELPPTLHRNNRIGIKYKLALQVCLELKMNEQPKVLVNNLNIQCVPKILQQTLGSSFWNPQLGALSHPFLVGRVPLLT